MHDNSKYHSYRGYATGLVDPQVNCHGTTAGKMRNKSKFVLQFELTLPEVKNEMVVLFNDFHFNNCNHFLWLVDFSISFHASQITLLSLLL